MNKTRLTFLKTLGQALCVCVLLVSCQEATQEIEQEVGRGASAASGCSKEAVVDQPYSCSSATRYNNAQWFLDSATTCGFLRIDSTYGTLSGTPGSLDEGSCVVSYKALDADVGGYVDGGSFTITVQALNDQPQIAQFCDSLASEGSAYSCQPIGSDGDGDSLNWYLDLSHTCSFLSINPSTGELSGTPSVTDSSCVVGIIASDGKEASDVLNFSLTVGQIPVVSEASACSTTTINSFENWTCDFDSTNPNGGTVTFQYGSQTTCNFLNLNPNTGEVTGSPVTADVGSCVLSIVAYDSGVASEENLYTFNINGGPTSSSSCSTQHNVGEAYSCDITISDPDGDTLTLTHLTGDAGDCDVTYTPVGGAIMNFSNVTSTADCSIRYSFSDGIITTTESIDILVNNIPVADGSDCTTAAGTVGFRDDTSFNCTITGTDADASDTVTYIFGTNDCGLNIDSSTGAVTVTAWPSSLASCTTELYASDGVALSDPVTLNIDLEDRPIVDDVACTLTSKTDYEIGKVGEAYSCQLSATIENDTVGSWAIAGTDCSFTPSVDAAGLLTFTALDGESGRCTLEVQAIDAEESDPSEAKSIEFFVCPSGYAYVAENGSDADFCVMQYEARAILTADMTTLDADGIGVDPALNTPVSVYDGQPWREIDLTDAQSSCSGIGSGYSLITNAQWSQTAKEIEAQFVNWNSGSVGTGCIKTGNSGYSCGYGYDSGTATVTDVIDGGDPATRDSGESFMLYTSTGDVIYDFSGNVWEWVTDASPLANSVNTLWPSVFDTDTLTQYGPENDYSAAGYGPTLSVYGGLGIVDLTAVGDGVVRGGAVDPVDPENAGIFATMKVDDTLVDDHVGFRCVYSP